MTRRQAEARWAQLGALSVSCDCYDKSPQTWWLPTTPRGTSLVVQRLRLHASNAKGAGSTPGLGARILHAAQFVALSRSVVSDSLRPHGLQPIGLLCPQGVCRQEYWSGLPCAPPGDLPNPGIAAWPKKLKQKHKGILSQMWRSEIQRASHEGRSQGVWKLVPSGAFKGHSVASFSPASRGCLHPAACGHLLHLQMHHSDLPSAHLLPLLLTCWLPSRKDPCDHVGPHLDHLGDPCHHKVLNGIAAVGRIMVTRGFPGGSVVSNLPASSGDTGSIPGLGRPHTRFRATWPTSHNCRSLCVPE